MAQWLVITPACSPAGHPLTLSPRVHQGPLEINFDSGHSGQWAVMMTKYSVPRLLFSSAPANNENDETVKDGQWWG